MGIKLLSESAERFIYSILGAQAKTRWSIVSGGSGKALQTQDAFRQVVKDTIVQTDVTTTISNMRTAIQDTHVTLNMVRNPNIILIPSKLIILKESIPGYNNVLQNPTKNMKFGINGKVNCFSEVKKTPKKILGSRDTPIEHLDTLSDNDKKKKTKSK